MTSNSGQKSKGHFNESYFAYQKSYFAYQKGSDSCTKKGATETGYSKQTKPLTKETQEMLILFKISRA